MVVIQEKLYFYTAGFTARLVVGPDHALGVYLQT